MLMCVYIEVDDIIIIAIIVVVNIHLSFLFYVCIYT